MPHRDRVVTYDLESEEDSPTGQPNEIGAQTDQEDFPETQFLPASGDSELLWEAKGILDEYVPPPTSRSSSIYTSVHKKSKRSHGSEGSTSTAGQGWYLVDWDGIDQETGEAYDPTWEPKNGCTDQLIKEWKEAKALDPGLVGRYRRRNPKVGLPPGVRPQKAIKPKKTKPKSQSRTTDYPTVPAARARARKSSTPAQPLNRRAPSTTHTQSPSPIHRPPTSARSKKRKRSTSSSPSASSSIHTSSNPGSGTEGENPEPRELDQLIPSEDSDDETDEQLRRSGKNGKGQGRSTRSSTRTKKVAIRLDLSDDDDEDGDRDQDESEHDSSLQMQIVPSSQADEEEVRDDNANEDDNEEESSFESESVKARKRRAKGKGKMVVRGEKGKGKGTEKEREKIKGGILDLKSLRTPDSTASTSSHPNSNSEPNRNGPRSSARGPNSPAKPDGRAGPGPGTRTTRQGVKTYRDDESDSDEDVSGQEVEDDEDEDEVEPVRPTVKDRQIKGLGSAIRGVTGTARTTRSTRSNVGKSVKIVLDHDDEDDEGEDDHAPVAGHSNEPIDLMDDEQHEAGPSRLRRTSAKPVSDRATALAKPASATGLLALARERGRLSRGARFVGVYDDHSDENDNIVPDSQEEGPNAGQDNPGATAGAIAAEIEKRLEAVVEILLPRTSIPDNVLDIRGSRGRPPSPLGSEVDRALSAFIADDGGEGSDVGSEQDKTFESVNTNSERPKLRPRTKGKRVAVANSLDQTMASPIPEEDDANEDPSQAEPMGIAGPSTQPKPTRTFVRRTKPVVSESQAAAQDQIVALLMQHWAGDVPEMEDIADLDEAQRSQVDVGDESQVMPADEADMEPTMEADIPEAPSPPADPADDMEAAAVASEAIQVEPTLTPAPAKSTRTLLPVPILSPSVFRQLGVPFVGIQQHALTFGLPGSSQSGLASQVESIGQFDSPDKAKSATSSASTGGQAAAVPTDVLNSDDAEMTVSADANDQDVDMLDSFQQNHPINFAATGDGLIADAAEVDAELNPRLQEVAYDTADIAVAVDIAGPTDAVPGTADAADTTSEVSALQKIVDDLQLRLQTLVSDRDSAPDPAIQQNTISQLEAANRELLSEKERSPDPTKQQSIIDELSTVNRDTLAKLQEIEARNAEFGAKLEEHDKRANDLATKLAEVERRNTALVADAEETGNQYRETVTKLEDVEDRNRTLAADAEDAGARHRELVAKLDDLEGRNRALASDTDELGSSQREVVSKAEGLESKNLALVAEVEQGEARRRELVSKIEALQGSNTTLSAQVDDAEARNRELMSKVKELEGRNRGMTAAAEDSDTKYQELEEKVTAVTGDLDFFKGLYEQASSQATVHATRAREADQQMTKAKSQLSLGLQQQKLVYAGEAKARGDEIAILRGQLKLLVEQNRYVNDGMRIKASKYAAIAREVDALEKEFEIERQRRETAEQKVHELQEALAQRKARRNISRNASVQPQTRVHRSHAIASRELGKEDSRTPLQIAQARAVQAASQSAVPTVVVPNIASSVVRAASVATSSTGDGFPESSDSDDGGEHRPAGTLPASFLQGVSFGVGSDPPIKVEPSEIVPGQLDPQILVCKWVDHDGSCGRISLSTEELVIHGLAHVEEQSVGMQD